MGLPAFHYWFMKTCPAKLLCGQKPHVFSSEAALPQKLRSPARMHVQCSSEEKAVQKWIYFWLPWKVTEHGTRMLLENHVLFSGAEVSNFTSVPQYAPAFNMGDTQHFAGIHAEG